MRGAARRALRTGGGRCRAPGRRARAGAERRGGQPVPSIARSSARTVRERGALRSPPRSSVRGRRAVLPRLVHPRRHPESPAGSTGARTRFDPAILRRLRSRSILVAYAWVSTAATALLAIAPSVWVIGAIGAFAFLLVPAVNATIMARVMSDAPDAVQARAVSATIQLTTVFHPLGPVFVGMLIEWLGTGTTIVWYAAGFLVLALTATATPLLREPRVRTTPSV